MRFLAAPGPLARRAISSALGALVLAAPGGFHAVRAEELPRKCQVVLVVDSSEEFALVERLQYELTYVPGIVDMLGSGTDVRCVSCVAGATASFDDGDAGSVLASMEHPDGVVITPLAACALRAAQGVGLIHFSVNIIEALGSTGEALDPPPDVFIEDLACGGAPLGDCSVPAISTTTSLPVTTTTTTNPSITTTTTTTTEPPAELCGDADGNGSISASDALLALRGAVGTSACPLARCDTDASGVVNTSDSLRILRKSVGIDESLTCSA
jgi:hypothetical protein